MDDLFKIRLDLSKSVTIGARIRAAFTLTNLSAVEQRILIWNTPLEGLMSDCFHITCAGNKLKYDGKYVLRAPVPTPDCYVTIAAGASVATEFDLSDGYYFDQVGTYQVEVACKLVLLDDVASAAAPAVQKFSTSIEVTSADAAPRKTEGMAHRNLASSALSALDASAPLTPTISGGTTEQQGALGMAWLNAYSFQIRSISALATSKNDSIFTTVFQVPANADNKATVSGYYSQMQTGMGSTTFSLTINPTQDGGAIAYTYLNSSQIWFNPSFFGFPPLQGDFSQAAIMVHELSHAVCSAPDCSNAMFCSYNIGYFSARVSTMQYSLTLPKGVIVVRGGIFTGSNTTAIWSPCNPNELGGWLDGDQLTVVCTFNLNPPISPQPGAGEYAGLCAGACSDTDKVGVAALISQATSLFVPNPGQLLSTNGISQITSNPTATADNIFYNAQSTTGNFTLTPASRGTLSNYIYQWTMTYNGNNTVVSDGTHVEIVFGYGDPMNSEVDS